MSNKLDRRAFVNYFTGIGLGSTLFPGALWAQIQQQQQPDRINKEMIKQAEALAGLEFTDAERDAIVRGVNSNARNYAQLRAIDLPNAVLPAVQFDPVLPGMRLPIERRTPRFSKVSRIVRPAN
jgi:hypothetical protein